MSASAPFTALACAITLVCLVVIVATLLWLWDKDWPDPGQRTAPEPEERT